MPSRDRIKSIMKNAYWLAKEKCAISKLESLCDLLGLHGLRNRPRRRGLQCGVTSGLPKTTMKTKRKIKKTKPRTARR